jgi:carbon-monoxide dehydrogenase large subunit
MATMLFGQRIKRREDPRLITGQGRYVADLPAPTSAHVAFLRSPHAHARIVRVNLEGARRMPGVVFAAAAAELGEIARPVPPLMVHPALKAAMPCPLAVDRVRFVGETVAAAVAEDRYLAEDAVEKIDVEYEVLPAVVDMTKALERGSPLVHESLGGNLGARLHLKTGDVDAAFARCDRVLKERILIVRGTAGFMENRGILAVPEPGGKLTVWASHQSPHMVHRGLCDLLGLQTHQLRVVAPDVGGGFGPKATIYPEDYVLPWLALKLGRPVRWIEDRREDLLATVQERDQIHEIEVGFNNDGTLVAMRDRVLMEHGAYSIYGLVVPFLVTTSILGQYRVPTFEVDLSVVYTHKVPVAPLRGAGRPQGAYVMERAADLVARELGIDPAEIRFKNFIQPQEFPYPTGLPFRDGSIQTFDSGSYPACLQKVLDMAGYERLRKQQAEERARGRHIGIGIGTCVESTGLGPYEGATVKVDGKGRVLLITGSGPQGQGHETSLAQVAADALGVPLENVSFVSGDTDAIPFGIGTISSRIATVSAPAVLAAATKVREKALAMASGMLEAPKGDLTIEDGRIFVKGSPSKAVSLGEVASAAAGRPGLPMPGGISPGLEATEYFNVTGTAFSSGTNLAVVEVDPETGEVKVLRYFVVHDCGRVINPLIVDGQIHGGVVHGLGNALYEDVPYGPDGQPLAASFMDYLIPTAAECPPFEVAHIETPSPHNPLGIKGCGESGTIPAAGTLISAIEDALSPYGVHLGDLPLNPERLRRLIAAARAAMPA